MKTTLKLICLFTVLYATLLLIWYVVFDLVGVSSNFNTLYIYTILYLPPTIFIILFIRALINKSNEKSIGMYVLVGLILGLVTAGIYNVTHGGFGPESLDSISDPS